MMVKNKRGIHMLLFWLEEKEHLDLWTTVTVRRQEEDQVKRKEKQEKAKIKLVQNKIQRSERETHLLLHVHTLEASLFLYTVSITCFGSWCSFFRNILPKRLLFWCRPIFRPYTLFDSQRQEKEEEQHQVIRMERSIHANCCYKCFVTSSLCVSSYIHRHIYSSPMPEGDRD